MVSKRGEMAVMWSMGRLLGKEAAGDGISFADREYYLLGQ